MVVCRVSSTEQLPQCTAQTSQAEPCIGPPLANLKEQSRGDDTGLAGHSGRCGGSTGKGFKQFPAFRAVTGRADRQTSVQTTSSCPSHRGRTLLRVSAPLRPQECAWDRKGWTTGRVVVGWP